MKLSETKKRFPISHHVLLNDLEKILFLIDGHTQEIYPFRSSNIDSLNFFNQYIDFAISIFADKFKQLYNTLAFSLEHEWYLVYAQCARSILENTAVCRYYSYLNSFTELKSCFQNDGASREQVKKAIDDLDRFVKGTAKFSWDAFLENKFEDLKNLSHQSLPKVVHVNDCLRDWYEMSPSVEDLYNLLCDMVHPNLGSSLLVLRTIDSELVAGGTGGRFICMFVVAPTLAGIVGCYTEIQHSLKRLSELRLS